MGFVFRQLPYFDVIEYIVHLIQRLSFICNYCLLGNTFDQGTQNLSPQHWMKSVRRLKDYLMKIVIENFR